MSRALAFFLCVLALPAGAATLPLSRTFQDWSVDCDNGGRCVAIGLQDDRPPVLVARIERDAGPEGGLRASLLGATLDARGRLLLDGRPLALDRTRWQWHPDNGDMPDARWDSTDPAAIRAFIDAVRSGTTLTPAGATADDGDGLSLRGMSAALLLVDDVQGRIGTRGALLRRGDRPDSAVPLAPALPVLHRPRLASPLADSEATRLAAAVRRARASVLADRECERSAGDAAFALTGNDALVLLSCTAGAYQEGSLVFRVPREAPRQAMLVNLPMLPGEQAESLIWFADYDPASGELVHHMKGRGLGDCGDAARWLFDGNTFHLLQVRRMPRCGGLSPDDWPTLWRATVAPGGSR